jgi:ribonuclease Y
MTELIISYIVIAISSGFMGYFVSRKIYKANIKIYQEKAKSKARAIEHEAKLLLEKAKLRLDNADKQVSQSIEDRVQKVKLDFKYKNKELLNEKKEFEENKNYIKQELNKVKKNKKIYKKKLNFLLAQLESIARLTQSEAKQIMFSLLEDKERAKISNIVRKYEIQAKNEGKKVANYIIAQATTRYAGDFASERLNNVITLQNDDIKGKIIGKEGRNIKALETLLGVDIIIDDSPNTILVSSFNLYRRAIATKTIELLLEDGRVQPARIEETYEKVIDDFENSIFKDGENIALELGLTDMHPEILKLVGKLKYRASYGQNALAHTLEVANLAGTIAVQMNGNELLAKRAGLLHDIGKALTQDLGGNHVDLGVDICRKYNEHHVVINAIYAHHDYEEFKSIESAAVCVADKLSAARPGARREVLEGFLKRVTAIEKIALSKEGVINAFAINAGREIRVIINANLINDDEASLIAKEIACEIQQNVQYPGDIKINVIRELRMVEYAK